MSPCFTRSALVKKTIEERRLYITSILSKETFKNNKDYIYQHPCLVLVLLRSYFCGSSLIALSKLHSKPTEIPLVEAREQQANMVVCLFNSHHYEYRTKSQKRNSYYYSVYLIDQLM